MKAFAALLRSIFLLLALGVSFLSLMSRPESRAEVQFLCLFNFLLMGPLWAAVTFLSFRREEPTRMSRAITLAATILAYLLPAAGMSGMQATIYEARTGGRRAVCFNNLKQIAIALNDYHAAHGHFPPAYVADAQGKPMHSWRVLILPFLDEQSLYNAYDFNEPWNGPNNRKLADKMPRVFHCPSSSSQNLSMTDYAVIVGDHTAFPGSKSVSMKDISDGPETILVVEIANSQIDWMEPRDLKFDEMSFQVNDKGKPCISSPHAGCANVALVDTHVTTVREDVSPDVVKAFITIDGGERVSADDL